MQLSGENANIPDHEMISPDYIDYDTLIAQIIKYKYKYKYKYKNAAFRGKC